ncbi:GNAT family N-acetyltransferase [Kineococcus rhizosphaerae]|uniref:Ribosomal protein S18 acetylase RimI-like enzyme n=1 Tax=Kineococcus rhizosphaerae TaxID=559628 RepID=A0A2T0R9Z6_9ACTN|nr:GNAT family N-acetyltransferase [Kineococcus rhizosphaerae]PRY17985.1 ribosomal protein S18 acetylase RimI-like enzyme [Kineococcus rhizosphaerae]
MARPAVEVRDAGTTDVDVLMELYASARFDQAQLRASVDNVRAKLLRSLQNGDVRVLIAHLGSEPAGYALITTTPLLPLGNCAGPSIEHLHVVPHLRRRGVGRALLRKAVHVAESEGAEQIACTVLPGDRDYTRYLARLGFAPVVVRRAAPLAVLRRRLFDGPDSAAHATDVVARRRSLRARLARAGDTLGVPTAS